MKRSSTIWASWNVWVTLLIRDEEMNYIQVTLPNCVMKRGTVPSVVEAVHELSDGSALFKNELFLGDLYLLPCEEECSD